MCDRKGIAYDDAMVTYLIRTHYEGRRAFRGCHPRDILDQILNASAYQGVRPVLNESLLDIACKNYFSAIEIQ
jgi:hypothetical protein